MKTLSLNSKELKKQFKIGLLFLSLVPNLSHSEVVLDLGSDRDKSQSEAKALQILKDGKIIVGGHAVRSTRLIEEVGFGGFRKIITF